MIITNDLLIAMSNYIFWLCQFYNHLDHTGTAIYLIINKEPFMENVTANEVILSSHISRDFFAGPYRLRSTVALFIRITEALIFSCPVCKTTNYLTAVLEAVYLISNTTFEKTFQATRKPCAYCCPPAWYYLRGLCHCYWLAYLFALEMISTPMMWGEGSSGVAWRV